MTDRIELAFGRRQRRVLLISVIALVGLPAGCFTYVHYWYPFWTRIALSNHRGYFESIVRQIEHDPTALESIACYKLTGDRLDGRIEKLNGAVYESIKSWRLIKARRREDGSWCVTIPVYLRLDELEGHGVMYCSSVLTPAEAQLEAGSEGNASRFDDHWWVITQWLGH